MVAMTAQARTRDDYTVGWICPLEVEQIAAVEMLDERHPRLPQPITDHNVYTLGSIGHLNVVIAGLPLTGNNSTATVIAYLRTTFPKVRYGLLVGIGGGVPTRTDNGLIRLGHVVVSKPTGEHSGAVQYDHGQAGAGAFQRTGSLPPPPHVLLAAAQALAVDRGGAQIDPLHVNLQRIDTGRPRFRCYRYPGANNDLLYQADYIHINRNLSCLRSGCDPTKQVDRSIEVDEDDRSEAQDAENWVTVHRGTIASGELVMRNGLQRDALAENYNVLCFETEAAGALSDFPCLVIRGISDYADSHKNDKWHGYASAVAAAYARELFFHIPIDELAQMRDIPATTQGQDRGRDLSIGHSGARQKTSSAVRQKPQSKPQSSVAELNISHVLSETGPDNERNPDFTRDAGWTILHAAVNMQNEHGVAAILETGFDPNVQTVKGWTPLWVAAHHGHVEISRLLLKAGASVNTANKQGTTALKEAAAIGALTLVQLLLDHDADMELASYETKDTPLVAASAGSHVEVVKLLLSRGADVNAQQYGGFNSLHYALLNKNEDLCSLILEHNPDIHARTHSGLTPLHIAAKGGLTTMCEQLLDLGAALEAKDEGGLSVLRVAVQDGQLETVKLLVARGANMTSVEAKDGYTVLEVALILGYRDVYDCLKEAETSRAL